MIVGPDFVWLGFFWHTKCKCTFDWLHICEHRLGRLNLCAVSSAQGLGSPLHTHFCFLSHFFLLLPCGTPSFCWGMHIDWISAKLGWIWDADTVKTYAISLMSTHTHTHWLAAWLFSTKKRRKTIWKWILDFRLWSFAWEWQPSKGASSTHMRARTLTHRYMRGASAPAHSMDDQKRPTAADHYANDTLSKSPESAATWQPLGIESETLKEGWRTTVSEESKEEGEIFIMYCSGKFLH